MNYFKHWVSSSFFIFLSMGTLTIKSFMDSYWLTHIDRPSAIAFGFSFPLIIFVSTVSVSASNAIISSFSMSSWVSEKNIDPPVFRFLCLFSLGAGVAVSLLLAVCSPLLIELLAAQQYARQLTLFCNTLIVWIPFLFLATVFSTIARGAGLFKSSGSITLVTSLIGILTSYLLLHHFAAIPPLLSVVLSNAFIALLTIFWIGLLFSRHVSFRQISTAGEFRKNYGSKLLSVFNNSVLSNALALVYIFVLIHLLSRQGEAVLGAMVYLVRIEQLVLVLYGASLGVMMPELSHLVRAKNFTGAEQMISQARNYLLFVGAVFIGIIYFALRSWGVSLVNTQAEYDALMFLSLFWFAGLMVQGVCIYYAQIVAIVLDPKLATKINFVRFLLVGIPLSIVLNTYFDLAGLAASLPVLHIVSLAIVAYYFKQRWSTFKTASQYNELSNAT